MTQVRGDYYLLDFGPGVRSLFVCLVNVRYHDAVLCKINQVALEAVDEIGLY